KIMNVVVPSVACPPTASKKIRRKPDAKPQSQINKCNNEKRRRELENEYIEQLGEFLQIKRDMTACKPDKAAILSEVVRTFRHMLEQGNPNLTGSRCSKCSPDCSASCKLHPVQQGEVSSTEPPLPEPSVNGHSPEKSAYFEAVQHYISNVGWALLEINSEGVIECATENVRDVLHYSRTELHGQSIYSYLHTGDHSKLSPILNKNSFELNWDQNEVIVRYRLYNCFLYLPPRCQMFYQTPKRTIRTKIRWLLRAPEGANETIEQKQQRLEKYKDLLIISAPVKDDTEESSSVLCLITLPEDDQATIETTTMPQTLDEQLTLKLDTSGNIIDYNSSTLRKQFAGNLTKESIRSIYDLCHYQDRPRLNEHLGNVRSSNGTPHELTYRLRLGGPDVYVHVKTQSKLFRCTKPNETDFIMAICTVLTENEVAMLSADSGAMAMTSGAVTGGGLNGSNDVVARHMAQITQGVSNMGGPLMSSVLNGGGGRAGGMGPSAGSMGSIVSPRSNPNSSSLLCGPNSDNSNFFNTEFELDFPHSTFDMEAVGVGWDSRPDSRTSVTPVSTPRPPSVSAYSPAAAPMCASPMTPYYSGSTMGGMPSPSNNNNGVPGGGGGGGGSSGGGLMNPSLSLNNNNNNTNNQYGDARLRNLLTTKRPHSNASSSSGLDMDHDHRNPNRILKSVRASTQGSNNGGGGGGVSGLGLATRAGNETNKSGSNNMLLQLLNDKSDDDESDARNRQGPSELLKQLQKVKVSVKPWLALTPTAPLVGSDSVDVFPRRRLHTAEWQASTALHDPSSHRWMQLCVRFLSYPSYVRNTLVIASVRAKPFCFCIIYLSTRKRLSISFINKYPKEHNPPPLNNEELIQMLRVQSNDRKRPSTEPDEGAAVKRTDNRPSKLRERNKMLASLLANPAKAPMPMQTAMDAGIGSAGGGSFATATPATSTQLVSEWDPELNEILNHVIEIAPEGDFAESELNSILGLSPIESSTSSVVPSQSSTQPDIHEKLAINAIQKSLMQYENVSSPLQPQPQPQFSGSPPAYPMHSMAGGANSSGSGAGSSAVPAAPAAGPNQNFTPPPVYTQRMRIPQGQLGGGNNPGVPQNLLAMQKLQHQSRDRILQEQQRTRLLQQQQKQQMVVTVNSAANADLGRKFACCVCGIVWVGKKNGPLTLSFRTFAAPNVTLTRANNVPDSQLSPGFSPSLMQQQLSPSQRTQLSPQQAGFQGNPFNNNPGHRLSPQLQQMVSGFGNAGGNVNQQLSPRQPPFGGGVGGPAVNQPNVVCLAPSRALSLKLFLSNAQLCSFFLQSVGGFNPAANRQFVGPPQRQRGTLNSPGTPRQQQNAYGGTMVDGGGFPGPPSPSPVGVSAPNFANPVYANQQMRLQRQGSVPPQSTQHLPGSPRSAYGGHGPGPDATGYGMMFGNAAAMQQHAATSPGDFFNRSQTGGGNGPGLSNGTNAPNTGLNHSELVRQELRAIVSGRAHRPPSHSPHMGLSPLGAMSLHGCGPGEGGGSSNGGNLTGSNATSTVGSSNGTCGGSLSNASSAMLGGIGGGGGSVGGGGGSNGGGGTARTSMADAGTSGAMLHSGGSTAGLDSSMLYNFHLTQKEFFGGNTSR
ncbi:AGAP009664-PA, partial [Anopheles gambiae str. PEST]